jgi:hypothetical protein
MPDFQHGIVAELDLSPGGILTGFVEGATLDIQRESGEVRPWGGPVVRRVYGLGDFTFTANGGWTPAVDAILWEASRPGADPVEITFRPDGVIEYVGDVVVGSYQQNHPSNGPSTWTINVSGADELQRT